MKFNDDTKQVNEFSDSNWLGFGVHEVTLGLIEAGKTDNNKEFVEFTVIGPKDEEDTARVWFTSDKSANFSFNIMRQIYVHCAPEGKAKEKARTDFDAVKDSDEAVELMQKCVGKKIWFTKYPDPTRTYQNQAGQTKQSINKNVYGYAPKLREDLMPKQDTVADVDTDKDVTIEDLGGEEAKGDAAANIPDDWS